MVRCAESMPESMGMKEEKSHDWGQEYGKNSEDGIILDEFVIIVMIGNGHED